jgi:hypothetical protein
VKSAGRIDGFELSQVPAKDGYPITESVQQDILAGDFGQGVLDLDAHKGPGLGGLRQQQGKNSAPGSKIDNLFVFSDSDELAQKDGVHRKTVALFLLKDLEPAIEEGVEAFVG